MPYKDKKKRAEFAKKWYLKNKKKILRYRKEYYHKDPERFKEARKQYYLENREHCLKVNALWKANNLWYSPKVDKNKARIYSKLYLKNNPWCKTYKYIENRVNGYSGGVIYQKLGIQNKLSYADLKYLWFRDKAYNMERPSIHRKNSKGHYVVTNCEYVEWNEHARYKKQRRVA